MLHCSEGHTKAPHEMPYSAPLLYDLCQRDIVSIMSSYSKELYSISNCITYVGISPPSSRVVLAETLY